MIARTGAPCVSPLSSSGHCQCRASESRNYVEESRADCGLVPRYETHSERRAIHNWALYIKQRILRPASRPPVQDQWHGGEAATVTLKSRALSRSPVVTLWGLNPVRGDGGRGVPAEMEVGGVFGWHRGRRTGPYAQRICGWRAPVRPPMQTEATWSALRDFTRSRQVVGKRPTQPPVLIC